MRFLCDEMLVRLARLLRAAGYDTLLAAGESDAELLRTARAENRILLTRDKRLAAMAHPRALLIEGADAETQAERLGAVLPVDWNLAPFTRCVVDNAHLRNATAADLPRAPPQARAAGGPFRVCPACGRIYWPGSHVRRMGERLARLARPPRQA